MYLTINKVAKQLNKSAQTLRNWEKTEKHKSVEDLVQIITVFFCKLQSKRANKMKKVIAELKDENI